MTHYFTFSDDTSHKFWQIETNDSTFSVTYGRIGTVGQCQQKTFDSADQCQNEANKLIREKTRKGYVEVVDGVAVATSSQSAPKPPKTDDQQAEEVLLNRFDELVRATLTDELLPFLQSVDKRHYVALSKKIKSARSYWCDTVELQPGENALARLHQHENQRWGTRGTMQHRIIVNLSALAILPLSDTKNFDLYWLLTGLEWDKYTLPILQWKRPAGLTEFLLMAIQKERWRVLDYYHLRLLEKEAFISYQPELFALSVAKIATYNYHTNQRNDASAYIDFLTTDASVLTRELPSLFDFPAPVNESVYSFPGTDGTYQQVYIWPQVFARLLAEGKLDRLWFFEKCLSIQTKDWNPNLRQFYRKQMEVASPSSAELLVLQSSVFPLLAAEHPHVVSWTVGLLKTIYTEPDFRTGELLDWATSAMMRDDSKIALKTLLSMLERLLKTQPDQRSAIASLLADVFVVNDLTLQTRAATLLIKYVDPTDADLQTQLGAYTGQMLGNVANDLRVFLTNQETTTFDEAGERVTYQYVPPKSGQRLVPGQEVKVPITWNDFVFLIGQFIASEGPLDTEILMNALILLPTDMPADFREQLNVYEKKLEKTYFNAYAKETFKYYLLHWLSGNEDKTQLNYSLNQLVHSSEFSVAKIQRRRISQLHRKRESTSKLPLLSFPTHAPHWVSPTTLINRLLAYQKTNEPIDSLDLAIAIARMPRESTDEAISLCAELSVNMANLMRYCLGASNEIELPGNKIFDQLLAVFRENNVAEDQHALWAVAARTFGPDTVYPEFTHTSLSNVPNVVKPFVPTYEIKEKWNEWKNYRTKEMERSASWKELQFTLPEAAKSVLTMLYSNDLSYQKGYTHRWHFVNMATVDLGCWYSFIPQQPEALFTVIAQYGILTADGSTSASQSLNLMLQPGFQLRDMSMLVLSGGLVAKKRETGALAAEVLIHHVAEQSLDTDALGKRLGWLLTNGYAPVQRLIDVLNLVKDVSPIHNKALLQTLDALFVPFSAVGTPLKNTAKLLELYLDLLVKLGDSPSQVTAATLTSWQPTSSLRKLCTEILKKA
ncbi:hypothetical protein BH09BAC4_BH09BAC4_19410 [soil metagenome]